MDDNTFEIKVKIKLSNPPADEAQPEQDMASAASDIVYEALRHAMSEGCGTDFYVDEVVINDAHGNWEPVFPLA